MARRRGPLDIGLLDMVVAHVYNSDKDLVHIQEMYKHLEDNYDFSEDQLKIHSQILGQKEPNWKHDLRNLLSNQWPNWRIVNPVQGYWSRCADVPNKGEDYFEKLFDTMVKQASRYSRTKQNLSIHRTKNSTLRITAYTSEKINFETNQGKLYDWTKTPAIKKISHIYYCGGVIRVGKLHRYRVKESAMIHLCSEISTDDESIFLRNS